jgi:DNA-binding sugar fermentation-stimulating protein
MSVHVPFAPGKQGVFLERLNRFVALVCVDGKEKGHISPLRGALGNCWCPGRLSGWSQAVPPCEKPLSACGL